MTYSIVARDPVSGELGVAVQSHWFSVGSVVSWAEAGVGAVATQSLVEPAYGPRGLELMRRGKSAPDALAALVAADRDEAVRQVAMVDRGGRTAVHTGRRCVREAGHRLGQQVSVQANMMLRGTVWDAMLRAFESAEGPLAERMVASLEAAEAEGGDIRGSQSAALLVVAARASGRPWEDRLVDLRVEDAADPVGELRRLLERKRAYDRMERGDDLLGAGQTEAALAEYAAAHGAVRDNPEPGFWHGATLASTGQVEEGRRLVADAVRTDPGWAELVRRLPAAGLMEREVADRLLASERPVPGPPRPPSHEPEPPHELPHPPRPPQREPEPHRPPPPPPGPPSQMRGG